MRLVSPRLMVCVCSLPSSRAAHVENGREGKCGEGFAFHPVYPLILPILIQTVILLLIHKSPV